MLYLGARHEFLFRFQLSKSLAQRSVEEVGVVAEASRPARFIKDNAVRSSLGETKNPATLRQRDDADIVGGAAGGLVFDAGRNSALLEGRAGLAGLEPAAVSRRRNSCSNLRLFSSSVASGRAKRAEKIPGAP